MNSQRKYYWLGNAIWFNLSKLIFMRNPNLWVYGSLEGRKFDDNSKYLYEYVNTNHSDKIRSVWLASDETVVRDVRQVGGEAYTFNSKEGRQIARKAGVAIYTHALEDFGLWPQVGGAMSVFLGHGVGFKQTYNAKRKGVKLFLKEQLDKVFSWIQRDITIATSEYNKLERKKIAGLKDDSHIHITGQPRNDSLKNHIDKSKLLKNLGIEAKKKIILYMPTYRRQERGKNMIEPIIRQLYECKELSQKLDEGGYVFVAKLHPLTPFIDIPPRNNFMILDYQAVKSTQDLQAVSDFLITDYSSCCVDFALTGNPVIFYLPDENWFTTRSEQVSEEFYNISSKNRCSTPIELSNLIHNPSTAATNAINDLFEDESIRGTCYSENVYKVICKEIGL